MCGIVGLVLAQPAAPPNNSSLDTKALPHQASPPYIEHFPSMAVDCLTALQHRGTESSGLVGSDGVHGHYFEIVKGTGLVREVYNAENLAPLRKSIALLGHNRYSTAGIKAGMNCVQPFVLHTTVGLIAIAHNGELVNAHKRRSEVLREGVGLSTDTDSELIAQCIAKTIAQNMKCRETNQPPVSHGDISRELAAAMSAIDLSYALLVMTYDRIYALRDPYGNRPLCIGKITVMSAPFVNSDLGKQQAQQSNGHSDTAQSKGEGSLPLGYIACSESCALRSAGAQLLCEVDPGEMVEISRHGVKSVWQMMPARRLAFCVFEYVYFARADSQLRGREVHAVRHECGRILAEEAAVNVDIVSTVPESASAAGYGYAQKSGIPYVQVLQRNPYVGRSFIQPSPRLRQLSVWKKFGVLSHNVVGKRIVLVDDSIVRGNTMGIIVSLLREHGAKEVHLRIASPPLRHPCYMGINIPSSGELIACREKNLAAIAEKLNADSVQYLSVEGLRMAVERCTIQPKRAAHGGGQATNKGEKLSGGGISTKEIPTAASSCPPKAGLCMACLTGDYPVPIEI